MFLGEAAPNELRPESESAPPSKRAFSIEEFCRTYGICRASAYVEIKEGRLRIRKCGRRTLIAVEDAENWFSSLSRVPAA